MVSFLRALDESGLASQFRLLVYDNSPIRAVLPDRIPIPFSHIHDPANGGLFRAYTAALELAENGGTEWLLLLDQDTVLDATYLKTLWLNLPEAVGNPRCAAMVAKLLSRNKIISPARVLWGGLDIPVNKKFTGIPPWEITALNSGTLLRASAIRAVGGFNPSFWLDYLDHWIFNRLHRADYSVYVMDVVLLHDLSVERMGNMSVSRYKNILIAEGEFYKSCKSRAENLIYRFRLFGRAVKMFLLSDRRKLFLPTFGHLKRNICQKASSRSAGPLL
jgi:GT2 family glycosyltransferase